MKTPTPTLACLIAEHPFARTLAREHVELLAEGATEATYEPGEILFHQGHPANRFHLIVEGTVALDYHVPGKPDVLVQELGPGEALGWSWLFAPFVWQFQARAVERSRVLVLDGAHLLVLSNRDHEFGYQLLQRVAQVVIHRLQAVRGQLVAASGKASGGSWSAPARK
jgi:CRP/FNR family transcriptional regulator, cyclic AMP receptor protein